MASGCSLVDDFGTGVGVAPYLVATTAHTVAGSTSVRVIDAWGAERSATVVGFDPRQDVAILRLGEPIGYASLGAVEAGDSAMLATWRPERGFATGEVTVTRLLRVTIEDIYVEGETERLAFEIDADVVRGDSGGPVFTAAGEVAGIVYAASRERTGVGFVLSSQEIAAVLDRVDAAPVDPGRCL
jgi:S1-C subfamily serine protease